MENNIYRFIVLMFVSLSILYSCNSKSANTNKGVNKDFTNDSLSSAANRSTSNGSLTNYYFNGNVKSKGLIINGKKYGTWLYYNKNGEIDSAFQFENDSVIYILDKNDYNFKSIKLFNKIIISIPQNWTSKSDSLVYTAYKWINSADTNIPIVTISHEYLHVDLQTYINECIKYLKMSYVDYFRIVFANDSVDNKYLKFQLAFVAKQSNMQVGGLIYWSVIDQQIYTIMCTAPNIHAGDFLMYRGVFESIADSFSVLNFNK